MWWLHQTISTPPPPPSSPVPIMPPQAESLAELVRDASACATLESLACGRGMPKEVPRRVRRRVIAPSGTTKPPPFDTYDRVKKVVHVCHRERKRRALSETPEDLSDVRLSKLARFTDASALAPYAPFLHFLPRLVNIVSASYRTRPRPPWHESLSRATPRSGDPRRGCADARLGSRAGTAA